MTAWLLSRLQLLAGIAALMLLVQLGNSLSDNALNLWGVIPRRAESLPGILIAPWLHGGWLHLFGNLSGLLVVGLLALLESRRDFLQASVTIILGSGLLVWLFARPGIHIGASGWLFGLWSLLLVRAWYRRSWLDLLLAMLVLALHGGWVFGLLPQQGVSFEYHLAGALCGGLYAAWRHAPRQRGRGKG
ncbi:MAG: rhomboid family intramembrane serine protease [Pseudomonas sp.]|uniref:rhomboid family intramembrane serine protease n=1 Tax=Pseudomonas sp. TaxID=306 RepID=UPI0033937913